MPYRRPVRVPSGPHRDGVDQVAARGGLVDFSLRPRGVGLGDDAGPVQAKLVLLFGLVQ